MKIRDFGMQSLGGKLFFFYKSQITFMAVCLLSVKSDVTKVMLISNRKSRITQKNKDII